MLEACTAAVLVGVMRLASWAALSIVPGAWSVRSAGGRSFGLIVGVSCLFRVPRHCQAFGAFSV